MAITAANLVAKVSVAGAEEAKGELRGVDEKVKETGGGFKEFAKHSLEMFGVFKAFEMAGEGVNFLKEQFTDSIKVAIDHQQMMAQTDQVLKSTASAFHGATDAVAGHLKTVGLSTKAHDALQKQLDAATYSLRLATDHWNATTKHTQAATDALTHAKERVALLQQELSKTSTVLVGGSSSLAATFQVTKEKVLDLADAFSKTTMFSADTVQGGENLLLTFTNIGRDVFPQATQAILDVSQAMGQDLKSSAIQVGKALGDPLTGMSALQRIGVTFSTSEKEQIKTMMAHNDIIGAQKIILHELSTEFGGSATAAGKTFGGQMAILKNQFEDIKIKIGTAVIPILFDLLNKYVIPLTNRFSDWLLKRGGLQDIQNTFKTIAQFMTGTFLPAMSDLLNKYIIPLGQNLYDVFIKSGLLSDTWNTLTAILTTIVPIIGDFVNWVERGGPGVTALGVAIAGVATIVAAFKLASWLSDVNRGITTVIDNFGTWKNTAQDFLGWLTGRFSPGASKSIGDVGTAAETSASEVAIASTEEEASLGAVNVEADIASTGIKGIGLSALGAVGPLLAIAGILAQITESIKPPFVVPGSDQSIAGLMRTITPGGILELPHHAQGVTNFAGGLAFVHEGELLTNMPPGTNVIPANQVSAGGGGGSTQPINVNVYLDGAPVAKRLMPHIVDNIRYGVGTHGL